MQKMSTVPVILVYNISWDYYYSFIHVKAGFTVKVGWGGACF